LALFCGKPRRDREHCIRWRSSVCSHIPSPPWAAIFVGIMATDDAAARRLERKWRAYVFFVSVVCIGGTRIIILVICRLLILYYVVDVYNTVVVVRQLYLGKLIGKVIYLCSSDIGLW